MFLSLFRYGYTFAALCLFVFLIIILTNLFLKSYKPQKTLAFIGVILVLFFVNFFLAYGAMQNTMALIRQYTNNEPTSIPQPEPETNTSEELPDIF